MHKWKSRLVHIWARPYGRWGLTVHRHTFRCQCFRYVIGLGWKNIYINKEMCTRIFPCITDFIPALQLFWTVSCCLSSRALQRPTSEKKKTKQNWESLVFLVCSIWGRGRQKDRKCLKAQETLLKLFPFQTHTIISVTHRHALTETFIMAYPFADGPVCELFNSRNTGTI